MRLTYFHNWKILYFLSSCIAKCLLLLFLLTTKIPWADGIICCTTRKNTMSHYLSCFLSLSLLKYYEAFASSLHFPIISLIIGTVFRPVYFISFLTFLIQLTGFPDGSVGKEYARNTGDMAGMGSTPGLVRSPQRRKWQPTPVFLSGKSHGQRNLAGYSPLGHKESGHDLATK